eukprot:18694-Heterococcus_DN1.PRE.2
MACHNGSPHCKSCCSTKAAAQVTAADKAAAQATGQHASEPSAAPLTAVTVPSARSIHVSASTAAECLCSQHSTVTALLPAATASWATLASERPHSSLVVEAKQLRSGTSARDSTLLLPCPAVKQHSLCSCSCGLLLQVLLYTAATAQLLLMQSCAVHMSTGHSSDAVSVTLHRAAARLLRCLQLPAVQTPVHSSCKQHRCWCWSYCESEYVAAHFEVTEVLQLACAVSFATTTSAVCAAATATAATATATAASLVAAAAAAATAAPHLDVIATNTEDCRLRTQQGPHPASVTTQHCCASCTQLVGALPVQMP